MGESFRGIMISNEFARMAAKDIHNCATESLHIFSFWNTLIAFIKLHMWFETIKCHLQDSNIIPNTKISFIDTWLQLCFILYDWHKSDQNQIATMTTKENHKCATVYIKVTKLKNASRVSDRSGSRFFCRAFIIVELFHIIPVY